MSPPAADSTKDCDKKSIHRKINKPLIEKRRRARINDCLAQLKTIVLEASDTKCTRPSKLEKADILEMTVEFVKNKLSGDVNPEVHSSSSGEMEEYLAGYSKCLAEISHFLEQNRPSNPRLKEDIVEHVSSKIKARAHGNETMCTKISIPAIYKTENLSSPTNGDTTREVLDLSSKLPGYIKQRTESFCVDMSCQSKMDYSSTSSVPVGFLCGGQLMLLVQIPQSVTPLPQSLTSEAQSVKSAQPCMSGSESATCVQQTIMHSLELTNLFPKLNVSTSHSVTPHAVQCHQTSPSDCSPVCTTSQIPSVTIPFKPVEHKSDRKQIDSSVVFQNATCSGNSPSEVPAKSTRAVQDTKAHWRPW